MPINGIPCHISDITQLSVHDDTMFYKNDPVDTVPLRGALLGVIEFLRKLKKPVILVAHNGFRFDIPILIRDIHAVSLWAEFTEVVHGFVDTFRLLQKLLPERKKTKIKI